MALTPQWLDELRSRTLLSALVGRTLKLTKAGREFKGCCPFHNEKTPSFYVNDDKGFYHCFGCSAHGDAIRWMTDQRGLPFMDAVKELAQAAGMEVPAADPRAAERAERANSLYDVMTAAADWFVEQLQGIEGTEARAYLDKRGIKPETVKRFGIGFAPDSKAKLKSALARFGDDRLVEAGLLISVDDKTPYDRFRGRLMIPIRDARGRVIAFGGRILGSGEPKYLNSPDTPLFDKGRTLYNLDLAGPASRKAARVIVVEGYLDVIALAQAGIEEAVAPLGTALTEHQLERLWRLVPVPLLCFDGDNAGQKAAIRAVGRALPALAASRSLSLMTLPKGQDPDDLVRQGGRTAFETLIETAQPLVDRLWEHEYASSPLNTPEARAGLKQRLAEHVQSIRDPDVRSLYQNEFRARFDEIFASRAAPPRQFKPGARFKPPEAPPTARTRTIGGGGIEPMFARAILAGLLRHPSMILACGEAVASLSFGDQQLDQLRETLLDAAFESETLESSDILPICEAAGLGGLAAELLRASMLAFSFTKSEADADVARRDLALAVEALAARPELDAALSSATARLAHQGDEAAFAEQQRLQEARRAVNQTLADLQQRD